MPALELMSIYKDLQPISLDEVSTYPLASRQSKVTVEDFATPVTENSSLNHYLASLPNILAVQSLRELAAQMRRARDLKKANHLGHRRSCDQNRAGADHH